MLLQRHRIDFGAGEEREQDRTDARQQRGVVGLLDVFSYAGDVAEDGADEDLHERHRDAHSDAEK